MADNRDSGADGGHTGSGNQQLPEPATARRILELMKNESGGNGDLTGALLDAGANPAQVDSEGVSILVVASRAGHAGVISAIATRYPEALSQTEVDSGYGALHHAVKHNSTDSIDALVEAGVNVELKDVKGCTALHVTAATAGCEAAVEALLRHDADKEQEENDELTPLLVAVREGNEAGANVLIEAGASLVGGHNDEKVLELAIGGGSMNGGANRDGCFSIMRTLVQRGVDVGVTAMHWAAWYDHGSAVIFLVEMGADIEAKAYHDSTPFHVAAMSAGNLAAIRALAWHGADVNARKSNGDTPLHVAANNCFFEESPATVGALLRARADETMVNAAMETQADILERKAAELEEKDEEEDEEEEEEDEKAFVGQIRKLLANAPADRADRAWARRRFVVMCRAFPGRVRLVTNTSPSSPADSPRCKKAVLRKACEGESGIREEGATNGDFIGAMSSLIGLQADLFRAIVEFL